MQRFPFRLRLGAILSLLVAFGAMSAPGAVAQDNDFDLPITKLDCESDPGAVNPLGLDLDGLPEGCTYAVGQTFTVEDADGTVLGTCTTPAGPPSTCYVTVPVPSTVTVTEDLSTAASGYMPRENPITVKVEPNTEASALFVNLPTQLPDTGTGDATQLGVSGNSALVFGALGAAFAAAGMASRLAPVRIRARREQR